jgi:putative sigma-54 modulation protein
MKSINEEMTMQINITGKNIDLTEQLKDFTDKKFERLLHHAENIISIHVTFAVQKLNQIAEAQVHLPGADFHAKAETEDMYASILELINKLERQILKQKSKI